MEIRNVTSQREQWNKTYADREDFFGKEPSKLALKALQLFRDRG